MIGLHGARSHSDGQGNRLRHPGRLAAGLPKVLRLEDIMSDGWWPLQHEWDGRWLLRASDGFTGRGNSTLPLGPPERSLLAAVDHVEQFYRQRDLCPMFALPMPLEVDGHDDGSPLTVELARRGYRVHNPTVVMTARTAQIAARLGDPGPVELLDSPDAGWLDLYRYRGQPLPAAAEKLLLSAPDVRFAALFLNGATAAVGRVAVSRGWAGITAMEVAPAYRRRGLGRIVLGSLAAYASSQNAGRLYLQVAEENTPAQHLYTGAGFEPHHRYHYRILD